MLKSRTFRALARTLIAAQVCAAVPLPATAAEAAPATPALPADTPPQEPRVVVNRTVPHVEPAPLFASFSSNPTAQEITKARVFGEPLLPGGTPEAQENRDLARAIQEYQAHGGGDDVSAFGVFLVSHPQTPWRASLLANLGALYKRTGYFTRARQALDEAWQLTRRSEESEARAVSGTAVGELLDLHRAFGHVAPMEKLIEEIGDRRLVGSPAERLRDARLAVWGLKNRHELAIPSGPKAVGRIRSFRDPSLRPHPAIAAVHADEDGTSLAEMSRLAAQTGMNMQMAFRTPGSAVVLPAMLHFKVGHFSALLRQEGERFLIEDPCLGGELWISRQALDEESSGYFLVPEGALPAGWGTVEETTADTIRGRCGYAQGTGESTKPGNTAEGGDHSPCPMATYRIHALLGSVHIEDTPVGYSPPRGPAVRAYVAYNQRESYKPLTYTFANLGTRWSLDWIAWIEDDPTNPSAKAYSHIRGGGRETSTGFSGNSYAPHRDSQAVVTRVSSSPIQYERLLPDGSKEVYAQPDGATTSPRRIFMTQAIDPQGNALTFTYDSQLRLVSVTDAIGQVTTLTYGLTSDPLKVTRITDPFGRSASFAYAGGQLIRITDVIGIQSEFAYSTVDFISAMTTPYGTTLFRDSPGVNGHTDYGIEATDPMGGKERLEWIFGSGVIPATEPSASVPVGFGSENVSLSIFNTLYWDKRAMALYPGDHTKAKIIRWNYAPGEIWDSISSMKMPLEGRVWYRYPGAPFVHGVGSMNKPIEIARVLDDGSTQSYRYEYNSKGTQTRVTDPVGRETVYEYDTNEIDLLRIKQKNGSNYDLLENRTYSTLHLPLTITDAAGPTTTYTYNAQGQLLTVTTPPRAGITENRTTTYSYDTNGYLQNVTGPAPGATTSYTYDGYGRRRTVTDSEGYVLTTDYDALDRQTKVTYPDGTYEQAVYNRLDAQDQRDRLGRWTHTFYDALRRPVSMRDPANRTTTQQWCACGSLDKIVDANNNATTWERDLQGRVTKEIRADGSQWLLTYETTTSRLKTRTDPKNQVATYSHLLDNNLSQTVYTNTAIATPTVSFTYDPVYNRVTSMTDGTGTTNHTYYPVTVPPTLGAGKLQSVDGPLASDAISYSYDELGRVTTNGLSGFSTTSGYDFLGRLASLGSLIGTFNWTYVNTTNLAQTVTYPNGQVTTYSYLGDLGDERLQEIKHQQSSGGSLLSQFDYTYDPIGNISSWQQQLGASPAKVYLFGYDAADEISSAVQKDVGTQQILKNYGYAYDAAGNRTVDAQDSTATTSQHNNRNELTQQAGGAALPVAGTVSEPAAVSVGGAAASVNAADQFTGSAQLATGTQNFTVVATDPSGNTRTNTYQVTVSGTAQTFVYDANGNLCAKGGTTCTNGTITYEWDAENRLVAVTQGGTTVASFVYDGKGRRFQKIAGGVTHTYVYDRQNIIEERLSSGQVYDYVQGPGTDRPLAQRDQASLVSYYLADHLGSIAQTTSNAGVVTLTREYDLWGNMLEGAGVGGYAFTGREWDPEVGTYYYRARHYDPATGRFISEDPASPRRAAASNVYAYALDNPVNYVDQDGRSAAAAAVTGVAVIALVTWAQMCGRSCVSGATKLWDKSGGTNFDKKKHCYVGCCVTRCMLGAPGATTVMVAQIVHELLGGWNADSGPDCTATACGITQGFNPVADCRGACETPCH